MKPAPERIALVDTLRGFLAWTVVLWHACALTGFEDAGVFRFFNGAEAVECFFAVSGFSIVTAVLGDGAGFSLRAFFIKRWWRIYPVYVLALLAMQLCWLGLGSFLRPEAWEIAGSYPLQKAGWQWLLHLFMLQGTVSYTLVPDNASSILSAAWSLAHEEQFYLLMPLPMLFFARKQWARHFLLMAVVIGLLWEMRRTDLFHLQSPTFWANERFVFGYYEYFLLGVCGAFVIHPSVEKRWRVLYGFGLVATVLQTMHLRGLTDHAMLIWLAVFALALLRRFDCEGPLRFVCRALEHPALVWLGRCSYSTYLFHWPLLLTALVLFEMVGFQGSPAAHLGWALGLGGALTLAFSSASFQYVERPLIRRGHGIAARFRAKK